MKFHLVKSLMSLSLLAACGGVDGLPTPPKPSVREEPCRFDKIEQFYLHDSRFTDFFTHTSLAGVDCATVPPDKFTVTAYYGSYTPPNSSTMAATAAPVWWITTLPTANKIQTTYFYDAHSTPTGLLVINNNFGAKCGVELYGKPVWPWPAPQYTERLCAPVK